jgi:hypothetical protein
MVLSARARIDCGMVSPSVFAVVRLTTRSKRFGCSTGNSAGDAPFRLTQEWPFALEYFSPTKSKEIRLEACVPLFANERVWAPDKKWANGVISEVASAPKGKFNDLCDTASAALINMRDHGLLSLGEEFRREERRKLVYRGSRERGPSVWELYEGP